MKRIQLLLFLLVSNLALAQTVTFIEKNDTLRKPSEVFIFLNDSTDISKASFVAKIKSEGSLKKPAELYETIRIEAQKIGANSFRFESFAKRNDGSGELVLSAYYSSNVIIGTNFQNFMRDRVVIFGDDDLMINKSQSFKVNGDRHEVRSGHYKVFELINGQSLQISKGGFTGSGTKINGMKGQQTTFLSLSGFAPVGTSYEPTNQGVGVSFTTGKIKPVEENLALLLMKIFTEEK